MREPEGFTDFVTGHQAGLQRTAFLLTSDWQLEALPDRGQPTDLVAETPDRLVARGLLATLPARQRAVLVLRFYEDMRQQP